MRPALLHLGQQGGAIHARHARIGNHQVDMRRLQLLQGGLAAAGGEQLIGLAAQDPAQAIENILLVVDQQQGERLATGAHHGATSCCWGTAGCLIGR
ncbi:hypothetical protein D9M68_695480 [compost metagenome]